MKFAKQLLWMAALVCGSYNATIAQSFYDLSTIQTIRIYFYQSNWDQLLDNAYATTGDYIMADSVVINGESF